MKNTSIWFYVPNLIFLVLFYGILKWEDSIFWEGDKNYILIAMGLLAIAISILVRSQKVGEQKKEHYWVHYALLGVWIIFFSLTLL